MKIAPKHVQLVAEHIAQVVQKLVHHAVMFVPRHAQIHALAVQILVHLARQDAVKRVL